MNIWDKSWYDVWNSFNTSISLSIIHITSDNVIEDTIEDIEDDIWSEICEINRNPLMRSLIRRIK